jgi:hypothetical protein
MYTRIYTRSMYKASIPNVLGDLIKLILCQTLLLVPLTTLTNGPPGIRRERQRTFIALFIAHCKLLHSTLVRRPLHLFSVFMI